MNYNLDKVKELADGDEDFVNSVIGVFVAETPDDVNNLRESIDSVNFEMIYQNAHKIKSNVAFFSMDLAKEIVLKIEAEAKGSKNIESIKLLFAELEDIINITIIELEVKFKL